jgi:hypothetical protein
MISLCIKKLFASVCALKMKNFQLFSSLSLFTMYIYIPANPPRISYSHSNFSPLHSLPTELDGSCHIKALQNYAFSFYNKNQRLITITNVLLSPLCSAAGTGELKMHHVIIWFFNCLLCKLHYFIWLRNWNGSGRGGEERNCTSWLTICISAAAAESFCITNIISRCSRAESLCAGVCCELHLWQNKICFTTAGIFNEVIWAGWRNPSYITIKWRLIMAMAPHRPDCPLAQKVKAIGWCGDGGGGYISAPNSAAAAEDEKKIGNST